MQGWAIGAEDALPPDPGLQWKGPALLRRSVGEEGRSPEEKGTFYASYLNFCNNRERQLVLSLLQRKPLAKKSVICPGLQRGNYGGHS